MTWKKQGEVGEKEKGKLGSSVPTVCVSNLYLKAIWSVCINVLSFSAFIQS